jgi:hypothetical protein
MAVHSIVTAGELLIVLFAIVSFPDTVPELFALCGLPRDTTRPAVRSFETQLTVLIGVLVVVALLVILEPEYRAVLIVIDAIGIDMFLTLLAIQFYVYALAARAAWLVLQSRFLVPVPTFPGTWPVKTQRRHNPGDAAKLLGVQFDLFGLWAFDRMRIVGLTTRGPGQ